MGPSLSNHPRSVATVQLRSTRLRFTDFGRDTASKAEPSGAPGDWLYVTWLDCQLSRDSNHIRKAGQHNNSIISICEHTWALIVHRTFQTCWNHCSKIYIQMEAI
jgi:hypothetical protein